MDKKWIFTGIILLFTGIILGAFGAHSLKLILKEFPEKVISFDTGVKYQIYSGFSFLIIASLKDKLSSSLNSVYWTMLIGTIFFSLSIYLLSIQPIISLKLSFLGPITPIGGLFLITSWAILFVKYLRTK